MQIGVLITLGIQSILLYASPAPEDLRTSLSDKNLLHLHHWTCFGLMLNLAELFRTDTRLTETEHGSRNKVMSFLCLWQFTPNTKK